MIKEYLEEFAEIADEWFKKENWLENWFEFYNSFYERENIIKAEWVDFQEMGNHIHSFNTMAIAKGNALGNMNLPIEEYRRIFLYIISEKDPINVTINNLYKKYNGEAYLPYFSDSSISELISYAFPNKYVTYNRRDEKALEILGVKLDKIRGEKFGEKFLRYNGLLKPIIEKYKTIVGKRTKTTLHLELDQFFSWLYQTKKMDEPILDLITRYKELIKIKGLSEEKYKWEFLKNNKGKPDFNNNILQELKSIKFTNLVYHLSIACLKDIAGKFGKELINVFEELQDESIDLEERIIKYKKQTKKLYKKTGNTDPHHQDERTISALLSLKYPQEYTLYKNSYYKLYCDYLGTNHAKPNYKYSHYLELIKELAEDYISKDDELIKIVKNELGQLLDEDPNYLLLAQDILYQVIGKQRDVNYWVFQGNPKIFDFETALRNNLVSDWTVTSHKEKIKVGDKVILWITGNKSGCYAMAEVISEPHPKISAADDYLWKEADNHELKAGLSIIHNLVDSPILKESIAELEEFRAFNAGNQGTNFSATHIQYNKLIEMSKANKINYWIISPGESSEFWDEFKNENIIAIEYDELNDFSLYKTDAAIANAIKNCEWYNEDNKPTNHVKCITDFSKSMQIGDVVIIKKGLSKLLGYGIIKSDYKYDETRKFKNFRNVEWKQIGEWKTESRFNVKTLTKITDYESKNKKFNYWHEYLLSVMNEKNESKNMESTVNQIFYGPPGTGKTYSLKQNYFPRYTISETKISKEKHLENIISECTWLDVIAIALIEQGKSKVSEILNNKWVQAKQKNMSSKTPRQTIWGKLGFHTLESCQNVNNSRRSNITIFNKDENSYWEISEMEAKEKIPEVYELIEKVNNYVPSKGINTKNYEFITFHQSYSYEDFIEGIKPVMSENETSDGSELQYQIQDGIFKKLCMRADKNPSERFAIFIDEINRGNVSAIFGELITLIEQDKRKGQANEISVQLPYSKDLFSVPSNIDIYGTMNTADRSVEALDTALRRRFSFVEMMPDVSLLESQNIDSINLKDVLSTINDRIEILIDRDHTIGHSYFMDLKNSEELKLAFKDKIVPLLQEYFYGDYGKIGLVLGDGFVKSHSKSNNPFAKFKYEGKEELNRDFYDLVPIDKNFDIINALENLLNKDNQD
jgi:hypothetical protein